MDKQVNVFSFDPDRICVLICSFCVLQPSQYLSIFVNHEYAVNHATIYRSAEMVSIFCVRL